MDTDPEDAGSLLQRCGFKVRGRIQSRFPSLTVDVIDDIVSEAIARVWRHRGKFSEGSPNAPDGLFPYIVVVAERLAIDRLRRGSRTVLLSPDTLATIAERNASRGSSNPPEELVADLRTAIAQLDALDQRVLQASMSPSPSGEWALSLARSLIGELRMKPSQEDLLPELRTLDPKQWEKKLPGALRTRKSRAIRKLREILRNQGYPVPEKSLSES